MSAFGPLSPARATDEEIAEVLDAAIGAKFIRLRDLPRTLSAQANMFAEKEDEARAAAIQCDREEARLLSDVGGRELAKQLEPRLAELRKKGARHRAAAERAGEEKRRLRERASPASSVASAVRELLAATSPDAIRTVRAPAIPKEWTVEVARAELAKIDEQITSVSAAPDTAASLRHRIFANVDAIAEKGAVEIRASVRDGDPARLGDRLMIAARGSSLVGDGGAAFFVWLLADEIKARLADLIPDVPGALTDAQRDKRLAELSGRQLELERIEEALIMQAETQGRVIDRRPDANALAVLGIEIKEARR